jgi:hypothetical protein
MAVFHIDITQYGAEGKLTGSPTRLVVNSVFIWLAQLRVMRMSAKIVSLAYSQYKGLGDFDFRELTKMEEAELADGHYGSVAEVKLPSGEAKRLFLLELYQHS